MVVVLPYPSPFLSPFLRCSAICFHRWAWHDRHLSYRLALHHRRRYRVGRHLHITVENTECVEHTLPSSQRRQQGRSSCCRRVIVAEPADPMLSSSVPWRKIEKAMNQGKTAMHDTHSSSTTATAAAFQLSRACEGCDSANALRAESSACGLLILATALKSTSSAAPAATCCRNSR